MNRVHYSTPKERMSSMEKKIEIGGVFAELNGINVTDKIEKKNGLSYLSWPYAWGEIKKRDESANAKVYENADGWCYHTDGRTCWVKVGVTAFGLEHIEYLPVMDFRNQSISADKVTSMDVNKAIQRAMVKAIARHGLGLYIYAGEDLPEGEQEDQPQKPAQAAQAAPAVKPATVYQKTTVRKLLSADPAMLGKAQAKYGVDFEKLGFDDAVKIINKMTPKQEQEGA